VRPQHRWSPGRTSMSSWCLIGASRLIVVACMVANTTSWTPGHFAGQHKHRSCPRRLGEGGPMQALQIKEHKYLLPSSNHGCINFASVSLRVRTTHHLISLGHRCGSVEVEAVAARTFGDLVTEAASRVSAEGSCE
jgi:hypothetical protein